MTSISVDVGGIGRLVDDRTRTSALRAAIPLAFILALQAIVSLATLHNTAFQDEGLYLYAGRQIINHWFGGPAPLDHYAFYFSGYPDVYPVIGGFLDLHGGLELARAFSLACMLGVTTIAYVSTRKLFPHPAEIFAAAAYACSGTVLYLGRLATFDALCLFLVALATVIALHVSASRRAWATLAIGPISVLAILAKYAAMLLVPPVLGLLLVAGLVSLGWRRTLARLTLALGGLALSLWVAYQLIDKAAFHAIAGSTTHRAPEIEKPRLQLFLHVMWMGGIVYAAAVVGLVLVFRRLPRLRLVATLLFVSAWLMPGYHIYKREAVSIDKHIAFALFFVMPLAGYGIAWLAGYGRTATPRALRGYWLAGLAVLLVIFTAGLQQSRSLYAIWANTSALKSALYSQIRDGGGRILAEDIEVVRYNAENITQQWQWNGITYFYYVNPKGHPVLGYQALSEAIKNRYFSLIELSFNYHYGEALFAAQRMAATRNYDLIDTIPFQNSFGRGHFYLWRLAAVPGHGDFRSLSQIQR